MASIPEQIGKYKILNHLGSGGTSIVYLGLHPTLKRKVVLKKLNLRGKKTFYDRFLQEAALMMDLNHDNIVKVYDHFKEGSRHYMVMEFVEGLSLDQIIEKSGPLNHETIRYILRCCCKALDYIHSRNIIHRDIKPSNIFISRNGDVKLGDFGIAFLDDPSERDEPGDAALVGTPSYMAPEQFSPNGRITARTDLYALGVSYFELLTGNKMFSGESLEELRDAIRKGRHLSLLFLIRSYGPASWQFIKRSTSRYPIFRYSSARRALRSLRSFRINDENSIMDLSDRILSLNPGKTPQSRTQGAGREIGLSQVLGAVPRSSGNKISLLFLLFSMLLALSIGLMFYSGTLYEWFLPHRYGRISIVLNEDGGDNTFSAEDLKVFLQHEDTQNAWPPLRVKNEKVYYRKSGFYNMKSTWGNRVERKSFYLPPLSSGDNPFVLNLKPPEVQPQKLHLSLRLSDAYTGSPLSERTGVFLNKGEGSWIPLTPETVLYAGNSYEITVKIPGYFESRYRVDPEFYQDEFLLDAALIPFPGALEVHHNLDKLVLKVDGKKNLNGGEMLGGVQRFGKLDLEPPVWNIPPGVYLLTWSGNGWEQEQKLTVNTGEKVVYRITADAGGTPKFSIDRRVFENY